MGNICASKHDKQQTTQTHDNINRNFTLSEYILKKQAIIDLIIGTYRCYNCDTLLAIVQKQYIDYCTEMRDYADNIQQIMLQIMNQKKNLISVALNKNCPYKKLQLCILPQYSNYIKTFQNSIKDVLNYSNDITIQLTHTTENSNGLPNQTLIAIFMKILAQKIDQINGNTTNSTNTNPCSNINNNNNLNINNSNNKKGYKISVIANDNKLLNLVRYQIIKLEQYQIKKVSVLQNDNNNNNDKNWTC